MVEAHTNLTNMLLLFMLICSFFGTYNIDVAASIVCPALEEYRAGTECCPKCPPGKLVVKDCTGRSITECSRCPNGTFQAGFNEQKKCTSCIKCDAGLGLKVKKSCSSTSDAVCEVLDGFFCSDSNRGGCGTALRHTVCSPGHYIGQRGTADKDTECLPCTDGTFSNGTSTSCQNHTKCEYVGLKLMKSGTDSTDSEWGEHGPHKGLVAGIVILGVILGMALMITAIIHRKNKGDSTPQSKIETQRKELSQDYRPTETTPLKSTDGPEPIRDQQDCTITIP